MAYRDVDAEAYKKSYAKKKKSKNWKKSDNYKKQQERLKTSKIASGSIDQRVQYSGMRKGKKPKKKYTGTFKTRQPEIEWANVGRREGSFGATFKKHKAAGDKEFTWKGKKYTTRTLAELETGKSEKERFAKAGKSKEAAPAKKGFFSKIATKLRGGHETQEGYEKAKAEKSKAKRIAKMEKRKEEGKSYSAKNLAALKGSEPKKTYIAKKKKSAYSISS